MKTSLQISQLRLDGGTQTRAEINRGAVLDYADRYKAGDKFPPVEVFQDGEAYWLADGFHRVAAVHENGGESINCNVHQGTVRDAILFAVESNRNHGLRRTNGDKRKAVEILLKDKEWAKKSDRWIADLAGVSHTHVAEVRTQLAPVASSNGDTKRRGRDGKSRKVRTTSRVSDKSPAHACPTCGSHMADEGGHCLKCPEPAREQGGGGAVETAQADNRPNVKDTITGNQRRELQRLLDKMARITDVVGIGRECRPHLDALVTILKEHKILPAKDAAARGRVLSDSAPR